MADSTSLSILRQTPLSSSIATKEWTEENFAHLSGQIWYGECSTAAATAAKAVTIPGVTALVPGMNFRIYFTNNQTYNGAPTLNVNGLGAKNIKRVGTTNAARYEWIAGETLDFVYDDNYFRMIDGGFATTSYYGVTKLASTATTTSDSYAATPGAIFKVVGNTVYGIPNTWTKNTQYSVGDKVYNAGKYYECIEANSSATFDATKFREIDNAQTQIDNLSDAIADIDIPEVPTDLSAFTNSPGYLTAHQSLSDLYTLSSEVVEGLSNIVIPKLDTISGLVEDEVEKVDEISAKLSSYSLTGHTHTSSDITNFPPIPTVNNGTLTIQKNGQNVQTFTANQSTSVSANIVVPTKTSDLTNDSNFLTAHQSLSALSKYLPLSGGTLTGDLIIEKANPVLTLQDNDTVRTPYVKINGLNQQIIVGNDSLTATLTLPQTSGTLALLSQIPTKTSELTNDSGFLTAHQSLSDYTLTSDFKDLISTITDELSSNINPKLSTIADQVSAETQKVDEISARLDDFALTSDIPSDYLSGVKMNESLITVTNKVADLGTVISSHQQLSIQDEYTDWVITPSYVMSVDEYSQDYLGKTIYLKWVEWEPGNPNASGWQPYVLAGSTIDWCGGFIGNLSSTELVWEELNWIGKGSLSAKRYKKSAVLGDQTSVDLALADHTHSLSDIANVPGVMQTGSYNDLLDKPTIPLSTSQLTNNSGFLTAHQSLSAYALSSDLFSLSSQVVNGLSNTVTLKLSTIADLISGETKKLDELSGSLSEYALTSQIPTVGKLNTTLTASQTVNANESLTGTVNLHKIAKTGSYNDLLNKPTKVSELSNDSGYIKKTELQSDLSNYLPLSGGRVSGDLEVIDGDFTIQQFPSEAGKFAKIDNMGLWINNDNEYVSFYRNGIHYMPSDLAGETMLTFPPYTENGEIVTKPYLSSYLSSNYLLKNEKTIMPIYGPWVGSPLLLSTNIELYQVLDMNSTGTFPVLSAPTNIASFGKCYYCFEIEWITNSAAASFSQQLDWINEPEIQSDGEWHTYYITGRYKSDNGEYTMNCWRVK